MKIVFLVRTLDRGGAQRQLLLLAKGLHERGHSISVIVFYANGFFENELRAAGVQVHVLHRQGRWDVISCWRQLSHLVQQIKPDIIHGYLETPNIFAALVKPPQSRVVFGVRASRIDYKQYDWAIRVMNWIEARAAGKADLIIANSQAGADDAIRAGFPAPKIIVIHNGIDTQRFCPDPAARKSLRATWQINDNHILIGLVGRLDPKKDHQTFLQSAAQIMKVRDDVRFVCVGGGDKNYLQRLQKSSVAPGLQNFLLWVDAQEEMHAVYNALDVLCSASAFGEGFANVIGEAMACGVPCVATNVGEAAHIIGDTGIIVPPENAEALAAGLLQCLNQGYKESAEKTRERIRANFSVQKLVAETETALLSLC